MTASSKRPGVNNKAQLKRPLCKQVLTAPVAAQWPAISEAQTRRIKQAFQRAADGLRDKKRLQPPWRELKKVPKDKRPEAISKFKEQNLSGLNIHEQEAFLKLEKRKKEKLLEIVFGYNEIMRHLSKGTLAAVLVNKSATPEFLAKSFLPGCYCRSVPVAAIDNLHEVIGKCIAVGFKESVKEEGSAFYALYTLMKDVTDDSAPTLQPSATSPPSQDSNARTPPSESSSKRLRKVKVPPPVVDVSRYHLIRGSPEQTVFCSKLDGQQWSSDVILLSSDIPRTGKTSASFDYRKKKPLAKSTQEDSSPVLGEEDVTECRESLSAVTFKEDILFELDYGGDCEIKTEDKLASAEANEEAPEDRSVESPTWRSSVTQERDATEIQSNEQRTKNVKREAKELEEKLGGASSYVPAAVMRVVGNPKRKKFKGK